MSTTTSVEAPEAAVACYGRHKAAIDERIRNNRAVFGVQAPMIASFCDHDAAEKRVIRALERLCHGGTSAAEQHGAWATDGELWLCVRPAVGSAGL